MSIRFLPETASTDGLGVQRWTFEAPGLMRVVVHSRPPEYAHPRWLIELYDGRELLRTATRKTAAGARAVAEHYYRDIANS